MVYLLKKDKSIKIDNSVSNEDFTSKQVANTIEPVTEGELDSDETNQILEENNLRKRRRRRRKPKNRISDNLKGSQTLTENIEENVPEVAVETLNQTKSSKIDSEKNLKRRYNKRFRKKDSNHSDIKIQNSEPDEAKEKINVSVKSNSESDAIIKPKSPKKNIEMNKKNTEEVKEKRKTKRTVTAENETISENEKSKKPIAKKKGWWTKS